MAEFRQTLVQEIAAVERILAGGPFCKEGHHEWSEPRARRMRVCTKCNKPYRYGLAITYALQQRLERLKEIDKQELRSCS